MSQTKKIVRSCFMHKKLFKSKKKMKRSNQQTLIPIHRTKTFFLYRNTAEFNDISNSGTALKAHSMTLTLLPQLCNCTSDFLWLFVSKCTMYRVSWVTYGTICPFSVRSSFTNDIFSFFIFFCLFAHKQFTRQHTTPIKKEEPRRLNAHTSFLPFSSFVFNKKRMKRGKEKEHLAPFFTQKLRVRKHYGVVFNCSEVYGMWDMSLAIQPSFQ